MNLKGRSLNNLCDLTIEEFHYLINLAHSLKKEKKAIFFQIG